MGLFSRNTINESYNSPNSIMNESIETPSIYDGKYNHTMESACRIAAENEYNYTAIMRAVGINELAAFENGEDFYINEGGGFFSSIVNFLRNVWEKIKGIFRKFIAAFDSMTKSDADFIKKYKPYITKSGVLKDFKYQGFKFSVPETVKEIGNITKAYEVVQMAAGTGGGIKFEDTTTYENLVKNSGNVDSAALETAKTKINDDWDDNIVPKIRSSIAQGFFDKLKMSDSVEAEELSNELFEFFRSGDSSKQTLEESDINIMEIITHLTNSSKVKKNVNDIFKKSQEWFNKQITKIDKISTAAMKDMPGEKEDKIPSNYTDDSASGGSDKKTKYKVALDYVNFWSQITSKLYKEVTNVIVTCQNAWLKALSDRSKQEKAICVALVNRGTNVKSYGESYSFEDEGSSYLGNVKLI